jgi:hypothetical protein
MQIKDMTGDGEVEAQGKTEFRRCCWICIGKKRLKIKRLTSAQSSSSIKNEKAPTRGALWPDDLRRISGCGSHKAVNPYERFPL